jgi:hypothetical protein
LTKATRDRSVVIGVLAALGLALFAPSRTARGQPDIIDAVLERPLDVAIDGELVRFGSPPLDEAERALRDGLPRPWTYESILPLFERATADWLARAESDDQLERNLQPYRNAVIGHLAIVLAASRDPRAALALGRIVEDPNLASVRKVHFMRGLRDYFIDNPVYVLPPTRPAAGNLVSGFTNALPYDLERAQSWFVANRAQLEFEAAALNEVERRSGSAPVAPTQEALRATIDTLIEQFKSRDPQLRVVADDGRRIRAVQFAGTITTLHGVQRSSQGGGELPLENGLVTIRLGVIGEPAFAVSGLIEVGGYERATFEIADSSARPLPVVTLKRSDVAK